MIHAIANIKLQQTHSSVIDQCPLATTPFAPFVWLGHLFKMSARMSYEFISAIVNLFFSSLTAYSLLSVLSENPILSWMFSLARAEAAWLEATGQ
jgi:hypothetical protein